MYLSLQLQRHVLFSLRVFFLQSTAILIKIQMISATLPLLNKQMLRLNT